MRIYNSISQFPSEINTVITIGTFDGLHKGHQYILQKLIDTASKQGVESALLTFFPHPRHVLFPEDQKLRLLNTIEEKTQKLEQLGLQHFIVHKFTKEFSRVKSINFIRDTLVNKLNMKHMVIGYDHHFGRNREGSFNELNELSDLYNFGLEEIQAQKSENITVSSTKIRKALIDGKVKKANALLGYNYILSGTVIHGNQIGRTIGFPTANIKIEDYKLLPKPGVYAVKLEINGLSYFGMLNIGVITYKVEVHIFNFSKQVYGQHIIVQIVERLRNGKNISNLQDLKRQLIKDENNCKKALKILR